MGGGGFLVLIVLMEVRDDEFVIHSIKEECMICQV